ncbi:MAG: sugar transferase [Flavobacteriaceae bacterium]|nr:sugar transferase [Flavobacteriaceae bacterium]
MLKRSIDLVGSFFGLLVLSPFLLLIAIAIRFNDNGPIFYRQIRVGKDNKDFRLFKFRSMYMEADKQGLLTVGGRDPRVTSVGYVLRKYKLDELPQLINVLVGQMSLVGPRPEVRQYVNYYTQEQMRVLTVKPGITDNASIEFIDENKVLATADNPEEFYIKELIPKKTAIYLQYVDRQSFWLDLQIIFKTIFKIFR